MLRVKTGFSLIEMIIVIALFSILAFIVTQSTLQSFSGSRKVDASGKVRDNLSFASSVIERNVRNAKSVTSTCTTTGTTSTSVSFIDVNGVAGSYSCPAGQDYILSGTARLTSSDISISACSFTCTKTGVNPPIIDFAFSAVSKGAALNDASLTTISRRVILRVY